MTRPRCDRLHSSDPGCDCPWTTWFHDPTHHIRRRTELLGTPLFSTRYLDQLGSRRRLQPRRMHMSTRTEPSTRPRPRSTPTGQLTSPDGTTFHIPRTLSPRCLRTTDAPRPNDEERTLQPRRLLTTKTFFLPSSLLRTPVRSSPVVSGSILESKTEHDKSLPISCIRGCDRNLRQSLVGGEEDGESFYLGLDRVHCRKTNIHTVLLPLSSLVSQGVRTFNY